MRTQEVMRQGIAIWHLPCVPGVEITGTPMSSVKNTTERVFIPNLRPVGLRSVTDIALQMGITPLTIGSGAHHLTLVSELLE